jgi:rare lipoprotein A (peptidoglycan hydrolase)
MMKKLFCLLIFTGCTVPLLAQRDSLKQAIDTLPRQDTAKPEFTRTGKPMNGLAAIYPADMDGGRTATGETFFNIRLTAAHNGLPLNSWVLVTNPKNNKSVILRINDRISKRQSKSGTVVILTSEAAKIVGIVKNNSIKVKIESIVPEDSLSFINRYFDTIVKVDSLTPNTFRSKGKAINGTASFYNESFEGKKTSTGERFRNSKLTAASNNFKLNTWVLVTNLRNKKSVIVRINDRMHPRMKKKGRVVDLSQAAAGMLDFIPQGLTRVKVQPIEFVFSPEVKKQQDSLAAVADSSVATVTDSVKTETEEANVKTGTASYYSKSFEGSKTSTGEIFRNNRMSAASNDFDLNTWVRVTNLDNNKSVVLRINDRMHPRMQKKGRVVDLSRLAAKKLDFIKSGLTRVKVEVVPKGTLE